MANGFVNVSQLINQAPDFNRTGREGFAWGQRQADDKALRQLAPGVVSGDPAAYAQAAAIDPQAAGQYDDAGMAQYRKLKGMYDFIEGRRQQATQTGDYRGVNAALREAAPYIKQLTGKDVPPEWTPDMDAGWDALGATLARAAGAGSGAGAGVQSTYLDNQGNRVAIMRDGSTQVLGAAAPTQQIIGVRQPDGSIRYEAVTRNIASPYSTPVAAGQPAAGGGYIPPAAPASGPLPTATAAQFGTAGEGANKFTMQIDGIPPEVQTKIAQQASAMLAAGVPQADVDAWALSQLPDSRAAAPGALTGAPEPKETNMARTLTPEETAARGYRPGSIVQVDSAGKENVVQAPSQAAGSMSAAERKSILAAKAKMPQLENAIRGLDRIDAALRNIKGSVIDTGPVDQYVSRYTPEGQELEKAVGAIQNSFLALTRVPGIGSQSDLEARIAAMQYPSLDAYPQTNQNTMTQLRAFANDLRAAYESLIQQDDTPQVGEVVDGFRFKGGDPADPNSWEAQ